MRGQDQGPQGSEPEARIAPGGLAGETVLLDLVAEVADAVVFLASDMAAYISGQTLSVCGALTM